MKQLFCIVFCVFPMVFGLPAQTVCGPRAVGLRCAMPRLTVVTQLPSRQQLAKSAFSGMAVVADVQCPRNSN